MIDCTMYALRRMAARITITLSFHTSMTTCQLTAWTMSTTKGASRASIYIDGVCIVWTASHATMCGDRGDRRHERAGMKILSKYCISISRHLVHHDQQTKAPWSEVCIFHTYYCLLNIDVDMVPATVRQVQFQQQNQKRKIARTRQEQYVSYLFSDHYRRIPCVCMSIYQAASPLAAHGPAQCPDWVVLPKYVLVCHQL